MKRLAISFGLVILALAVTLVLYLSFGGDGEPERASVVPGPKTQAAAPPVAESRGDGTLPRQKILSTDYYVSQTRNNCAPAALSLALSYYGISASQEKLAATIRPLQSQTGDDDKSSTLGELAKEAQKYGLTPYERPGGTIELLKQYIANDTPVIVRTLLEPEKDYGHYRVVKGYDEGTHEIIQDDSLQGKNLRYSYDDFMAIWQEYNYEYLVLARPEDERTIESILGEDADTANAWKRAVARAEQELTQNPNDVRARFNLATALYYTGDYEGTVREFERVESRLGTHVLWYQMEPLQAYYELGKYERVFTLSERAINDGFRAYAEAYLVRGMSYLKLGDREQARVEFEKAVLYNKNLSAAKDALASVAR